MKLSVKLMPLNFMLKISLKDKYYVTHILSNNIPKFTELHILKEPSVCYVYYISVSRFSNIIGLWYEIISLMILT